MESKCELSAYKEEVRESDGSLGYCHNNARATIEQIVAAYG